MPEAHSGEPHRDENERNPANLGNPLETKIKLLRARLAEIQSENLRQTSQLRLDGERIRALLREVESRERCRLRRRGGQQA
jgi:hypothetical protein